MKRKFHCRMSESPLFTVECIVNLTFQTVVRSCKEFEIPTLHSKFLEILKFVFLSEVAHIKSFCVKFSGLISKLKILENWYLSPRIFKVRTYIWSPSKKNLWCANEAFRIILLQRQKNFAALSRPAIVLARIKKLYFVFEYVLFIWLHHTQQDVSMYPGFLVHSPMIAQRPQWGDLSTHVATEREVPRELELVYSFDSLIRFSELFKPEL